MAHFQTLDVGLTYLAKEFQHCKSLIYDIIMSYGREVSEKLKSESEG